jgi:chromosome segregation ATPase
MWPKLLFDLLPHFTRLMPMADKYFATRSATDRAQAAALVALAADVRGKLDPVTEACEGMQRQMVEHSKQMTELAVDVTRTRMGMEGAEARIARLEKAASATVKLLGAAVALLVIAIALMTILLVHGMR